MVARPGDISAAIPKSSFDKPPSEPPQKPEDEVLQLPKDENSRKTVFASEQEIRSEMASQPGDEQVMEIPPLGESPVPEPPKFAEPSFGDVGSKPPSPFDAPQDKPSAAPDFQKTSPPIPSPFSEPKPVEKVAASSFEPPKASPPPPSPFDAPKPSAPEPPPPSFHKEPEPVFQQSAGGSPFDQPSAPPPGPADWNPPAVPDTGWQNPPAVKNQGSMPAPGKTGPNSTLAIVSLVLGIASFICGLGPLAGVPAIIVGFMQRGKIKRNPGQYSGSGMAMIGILLGVLNFILVVVVSIFYGFLIYQNMNNF
jgi:hypothetical protein